MFLKLPDDLCNLALERPSLHNGSTLIALENTKEFMFFEDNFPNIHPKNMKLAGKDWPFNSTSFDV